MSEPTLSTPAAHPIGERLRAAGINQVVIVDDAYDPPAVQDYTADDVAQFLQSVRREPAARAELAAIREVSEAADVDEDLIVDLWHRFTSGQLEMLRAPVVELFRGKIQQFEDVEALRGHLRQLGFEPQTMGRNGEPPADARLVFLDYVLDPSATMDLDGLATAKASELYRRAGAAEKPFIVLMSDRPDAPAQQERFRTKSELLGGLFGFISKADATVSERLFVRLGSWGIGNATHQELQRFVDAVVEAVDEAADSFKTRVRSLGVQDYAFIQRLSLHKEGHPLGDYILWLFEASLGYGLRNNGRVRQEQARLDRVRFEKYLPCQNPPSQRLADFFLYAITEPAISELAAHPHDPDAKVPMLGLGDVFVRDTDGAVRMVITAACDLAFSPAGGRKCDLDQPIHLCPGVLQPIGKRGVDESDVRTELISHLGEPHRILWDYAHAATQRLEDVWTHLRNSGFTRRCRLRLPYALIVQQAFANHVTRVGMPVPPPIFGQADAMLYCKGADGKSSQLGDVIRDGVVLLHGRDSDHFLLTVDCVNTLLHRVEEAAAKQEERAAAVDSKNKNYDATVRRIREKADAIRSCRDDAELWVSVLETPMKLPSKIGGKHEAHAQHLWVFRGGEMGGDYPAAGASFALNILPSRPAKAEVEVGVTPERGRDPESPAGGSNVDVRQE